MEGPDILVGVSVALRLVAQAWTYQLCTDPGWRCPSAMTHQGLRRRPQEYCVEYVFAFQTAMMGTIAIVTLGFFVLDLI